MKLHSLRPIDTAARHCDRATFPRSAADTPASECSTASRSGIGGCNVRKVGFPKKVVDADRFAQLDTDGLERSRRRSGGGIDRSAGCPSLPSRDVASPTRYRTPLAPTTQPRPISAKTQLSRGNCSSRPDKLGRDAIVLRSRNYARLRWSRTAGV